MCSRKLIVQKAERVGWFNKLDAVSLASSTHLTFLSFSDILGINDELIAFLVVNRAEWSNHCLKTCGVGGCELATVVTFVLLPPMVLPSAQPW